MHRVIEVLENAEPFFVIAPLPVIAEDEDASEETPTLGAHIEDIDAACPFDEPEDEGDNDNDRIGQGVKQSLVAGAACPFAHIDLDVWRALDAHLEEIVDKLWSVVNP